jgi:hypothetical protein
MRHISRRNMLAAITAGGLLMAAAASAQTRDSIPQPDLNATSFGVKWKTYTLVGVGVANSDSEIRDKVIEVIRHEIDQNASGKWMIEADGGKVVVTDVVGRWQIFKAEPIE